MNCPRCSVAAAPDAKFCSSCGAPLTRSVEGERRIVTVLFCDVKGSTTLAEKLDPEDWAAIIGGAFDALSAPVARYDGTVARLMGDALLAYFGAPTAHEDDPERAILAAFEMRQAVATHGARLTAERGLPPLEVRIGINTGLAVVGEAGRAIGVEYTAMGDAVNVAARVQSAAQPGQILVGSTTQRLAMDDFEFRSLGSLEVKGRTAPVEAFEVLGRRAAERARPTAAPLVGRVAEMARLREAAADVRTGRGRIVALVGETGIGKSRLIDELHGEWEGEGWSEARGQSYGATQPFLLFRQHLLQWCAAHDDDDPERLQERVTAALGEQGDAVQRSAVALGALLGREGPAGSTPLEGQALRDEIVALAERLAQRRFATQPGVVVFDDLHWSDPASIELLARLFPLADTVPVLFLCAFRPERQAPSWRVKQTAETDHPHLYGEVAVGALGLEEAAALLDRLLEGADLPARLRETILEKAEGNPLFLEEIVRSLRQDGALAGRPEALGEVRLPDTLQGLVAARIDRLEEDTRHTLQAAAVIGRTFAYDVLRRIADADEGLDRHLATLQRVDLVREVARQPERLYAFRHPLTQEAAYTAILQRRRRELHLRVAETLLELHADRMEDYAGLIGRHFHEAGDPRAVAHLRAAGDRAMRLFALEDAIGHYTGAIDAADATKADADTLIALYGGRGRAHELRGDHQAALGDHEALERLGRERADLTMELTGLSHRITLYATPTSVRDVAKAEELNARALPLARGLGETPILPRLLWNEMQVLTWRESLDGAMAAAEEGIVLARRLGQRELLAYILNDAARAHRFGGHVGSSRELLREAGAIFRELGNTPMVTDNLSTTAYLEAYAGNYDGALAATAEARRISEETNNEWGRAFSAFGEGLIHFDRGDYGRALAVWEEGLPHAVKAGFIAYQVGPRADLAWVYRESGDPERADAHLRAADETAAGRFADWRAWTLGQRARAAVAAGRLDEASELVAKAESAALPAQVAIAPAYIGMARIELALATGENVRAADLARHAFSEQAKTEVVPFRADWRWFEGEAERRAGRLDAATTALAAAEAEAREIGSKRNLWRILASQASIAEARGDAEDAERRRSEARTILDGIADSLEPVGLRERFLALPEVRAARGETTVPAA